MAGLTRTATLALSVLLAASLTAAACGGDPPRAADDLYADFCSRCHGADGRGDRKKRRLNPDLDLTVSQWVAAGADAEIRERIAEGHGSMPGFKRKLSAEEIEALAVYLERFRPSGEPGP